LPLFKEISEGERMKSKLVVCGLIIVSSSLAIAQLKEPPVVNGEGRITTKIEEPSDIFSRPRLMAGIKSYDDSGRPQELSTPGQRQFRSKNEFFFGVRSKSGFGIYGQAVEYVHYYTPVTTTSGPSKPTANAKAAPIDGARNGDPSLSLMNPFYSDDRLSVTGQFREYFPVSVRSVNQGIYQQAYYVNLLYKMHGGLDFYNQLVPRYFSQMTYKATDGVFYTEDWTTISRQFRPWIRAGFGQHYQVETHNNTPAGQTVEVFPYADLMLTKTVYIGPRIYFPVAVQNSVYDAPTAVSANNIQAEVYFQATL
jgi:hypothetical protein